MYEQMRMYCMKISLFKRLACLLSVLVFSGTSLKGQEYKYEIGGMIGGSYYMGDLNKNSFFKGLNPSLGAIFRYNPNLRWAVKTDLLWGRVSGSTEGQCLSKRADSLFQPRFL